MYSTHVAVPHVNPCLWFGCLLELLVDRTRGDTKHRQWRHRDGSVHIIGAWIHVSDIREAYAKGYAGTLRICEPQMSIGLRAARPEHTLRDALAYVYAKQQGVTAVDPFYSGKKDAARELVEV